MMFRRRFVNLALTSLAAGLPLRLQAQDAPVLRVSSTANDSYGEAMYAVDQGFFKKAGLNVDLQTLSSGAAIVAAVAASAVDIGITNPVPLIAAISHGIPFLYLCSGGLINQAEAGLCVASNSTIRTGKDFEGKIVASPSISDINTVAMKAWVDQQGGDSSKVQFVEMPFPAMAAALRRGVIDVAPIAEPAMSVAKKDGGLRFLQPPVYVAFGNNFMIGGWFAKSDWIQSNRDTARRFVSVIYDTARWANAHPLESSAILAKYAKLDPDVVKDMNRAPYGTSLVPSMIQPVLDLSYKYKVIDRPYSATSIIANL